MLVDRGMVAVAQVTEGNAPRRLTAAADRRPSLLSLRSSNLQLQPPKAQQCSLMDGRLGVTSVPLFQRVFAPLL